MQIAQSCHVCNKSENLSRCSSCKSVYYCSPECQKQDWKSHKIQCSEIQLAEKRKQETIERKAKGIKSIDDYQDFHLIGNGNFSEILRVTETDSKKTYALKRIEKRKLQQVNKEKDVLMEKHCLGKLIDNPNVIRLYATFQDEFNLYMLMEYIDGGELWQQIHGYGAGAKTLIKYFTYNIMMALHSIHQKGIIHRDIKSENILLTKDEFRVKVIDFGTARDMLDDTIEGAGNGRKGKKAFKHFVGTPQFMSPECIRNRDSTEKSDVYSLGVLFYQIIYGKFPYEGNSDYLIFSAALETELQFPEGWIQIPELEQLIKQMLIKDPDQRPSMDDIKNNEYFSQPIGSYQESIDAMDEEDKFLFNLIQKLRLAQLKEDKIQVEHLIRKAISEARNDVYSHLIKYVEQRAEQVISKWVDDDQEFQQ